MTFQMIFEQKFPLFSVTEAVYRLVTKMTTQTPDPLHFFQKNIHRMVDSLPKTTIGNVRAHCFSTELPSCL